jgi:60 kDa SS-A/Ro ribonucleoprotein
MQPIPGTAQVRNSACGYTWEVDQWMQLERFLILGSESGTFYINAPKLTEDNANNVFRCIEVDGERTVRTIVNISEAGRAPKNDPAIFALALVASYGDDKARALALHEVGKVCRTGTHLFAFAEACDGMRGWGRGLRKSIGRWYNAADPRALEYQAVKYQQRGGWSHRDLLRLAHPVPATDQHRAIYKWIVDEEVTGQLPLVEAIEKLKSAKPTDAAKIIQEAKIPREAVPSELLNSAEVWEALLDSMPVTAMVRNLGVMSKVGLLTMQSQATKHVVTELSKADRLKKSRVHPVALLIALRTYARGAGFRGGNRWTPMRKIVDALDKGFYLAFSNLEPTGKRFLLGIDVSGSMGSPIAGLPMSCAEGAAAMAMATVASEDWVVPMAFGKEFRPLNLSRRQRLDDVLALTTNQTFGATDCSLPMQYAMERRLAIDTFVVYTDNETWHGSIHPAQALRAYRERMGIDAKLIVVGMVSNGFSIADPTDRGMLDVVGFDANVPGVVSGFA